MVVLVVSYVEVLVMMYTSQSSRCILINDENVNLVCEILIIIVTMATDSDRYDLPG